MSFRKDGAESGRVEVTKLDKHTVDAAQMEVPMGYKEVTIEEMFQGMGGGGLPPGDLPHGPPHGGHHGRHHGKPDARRTAAQAARSTTSDSSRPSRS